ncbi:LCP family protein [Rossellomorea oryzaecorticis]|uniref:Regulatory protein MsrR n=1 Tax=Rossellomorea oryzaecorticis TaxID=1396505 RepID=A0ABW8VS55_9BACI
MFKKWTAIPIVLLITFIIYAATNTSTQSTLPSEMTEIQQDADVKSTNETEKTNTIFPINKEEAGKPINVLVVGSDQRKNEAERADVLIVAQYVPNQPTLKLISIMRDTYVDIPGYGKSKINHAYAWGGNDLVKKSLKQNFDLEINHTVNLNFQDFINMMGIIFPEGVQVPITEGMISHWKWDKQPGTQKLKGGEILQYVRYRGDVSSDFGRVERQQEIIALAEKNIMDKLKSGKGIPTAIELVREGFKNVETTFSVDQVMKHGLSFLFHPIDSVETLRIPVEGSYQSITKPGAGDVLEMDETTNIQALREFSY